MIHNLRGKLIILIFLSSFIFTSIQVSAEEDHLIIRVIDANYPPARKIYDKYNFTSFTFTLDYQIENPTHNIIKATYGCTPLPFPRLKTNLVNKSLIVEQFILIEWIGGERFIHPGIQNGNYIFNFDILDYENRSLPQGTYELWMDYSNCSSVPVPVVTEKLFIYVNETSIIYNFEYNNETRIVSSLEQTTISIFTFVMILFFTSGIIKSLKRRKKSYLQ